MRPGVTRAYQQAGTGAGEHWWFTGRRRIFARLLAEVIELPENPRLLDLGPGHGVHTGLLAGHGQVLAVDRDPASLRACRDRAPVDLLVADAAALPIAEGSCDLVLALDVLEHLDDDRVALFECWRVLRPGGQLLVTVPALRLLWGRQDVLSEHRRRYRRRELRDRVRAAGFEIQRLSYLNCLLFLPTLAVRVLMRPFLGLFGSGRSDLDLPAPFGLNRLLAGILGFEGRLLTRWDLPIGVSLLCVARRPGPN